MDRLRALLAAGGLHVASSEKRTRISRVLGAREQVYLFEIRRAPRTGP